MEKTNVERTTEKCGCVFERVWDDTGSCCYMVECRCQKHYDEQKTGIWYDRHGVKHVEELEPRLPLLKGEEK